MRRTKQRKSSFNASPSESLILLIAGPGVAENRKTRSKNHERPPQFCFLCQRHSHRRTYPELHLYLHHHYQICRNRGYVLTSSGRLIRPDFEWDRLTRQDCANWPIQGDAADCMLLAVKRVYWALRKAQIRGGLIGTVHDELIAEVHQDDSPITIEIMEREMVRAFEQRFPGAPTTNLVDINFGRTWAEAARESR